VGSKNGGFLERKRRDFVVFREREREGFWGRERELIIERQELVETGRRAHGWWGPFAYTYTAFTAHTHPLTPLVYFLCGVFVWWICFWILKLF